MEKGVRRLYHYGSVIRGCLAGIVERRARAEVEGFTSQTLQRLGLSCRKNG